MSGMTRCLPQYSPNCEVHGSGRAGIWFYFFHMFICIFMTMTMTMILMLMKDGLRSSRILFMTACYGKLGRGIFITY